MFLDQISICNFKNIEQADLQLSPNLNCFVGDNGEGKTNLLDAVYYLSLTKSFFNSTDLQNIRHKTDFFTLQGTYERNGNTEKIFCGVQRGSGKTMKRNGKTYDRFSDHIGLIPIVMISPTDGNLINDAADERRRYLNSVISQLDNIYLDTIIKYNRALMQRNRLLKLPNCAAQKDMFDALNTQMNQYAQTIFAKRLHFVNEITEYFNQTYSQISDDKERVCIEYKSDLANGDFIALLEKNFQKDIFLQYTTAGIHRDDIIMRMGDFSIKKTGSQGQQKTFLVALKLTQFNYFKQQTGISPILLLDDVFDKLDVGRVERLVSLVAGNDFGQIFITDSNKNRLDKILEQQTNTYALFNVLDGHFEKTDMQWNA